MFNHFALKVRLLQLPTHCHVQHFRRRKALPIRSPPTAKLRRVNTKFQTLRNLELVPPKLKRSPNLLWMSPESIRLIDKRGALQRNLCNSRNMKREITIAVQRYLM